MKKFSKILILLAVFSFSACDDAIDIEQVGRLGAEQAFQTVNDLDLGLNGVYDLIDYRAQIRLNANMTDEVAVGLVNGGQGLAMYQFVLNSASALPGAIWTNHYALLNAANRVIVAAEAITPSDDELGDYNNILGQLYAIRAFAHFDLLTYYSTDLTDDAALGVILLDFVPTIDQFLERNTNGEVFALINADLDRAENLMTTQADPIFTSLDFVTALRARMAAYRGNYTAADGFAAGLIASYPLADRTEYADIFSDDGNAEVIFKLERTIGDTYDQQANGLGGVGWVGNAFSFSNATAGGGLFLEMSRSLFNELDDADIRKDVLVEPTSVVDPDYEDSTDPINTDILAIGKYRGSEGQPLMNDLKIFRVSEMYFIRAEAAADAGNFAAAAEFIGLIRDARFGTPQTRPTYTTEQEAFAGILAERRLELAYEGFRWVDIKRIGERANRGVDKDPFDCSGFANACSLPASDFRFTLPIPIVELNANDNIQQNNGYE